MSEIKIRRPRPFLRTLFRSVLFFLLLATIFTAVAPAPSGWAEEKKPKIKHKTLEAEVKKLPEKYRVWVEEVTPIITDEELAAFLALEKDYQKDAFIKRFWQVRDNYKGTARNEFYDRYQTLLEHARLEFGTLADERARILLLNGPPAGRLASECNTTLWPLEAWYYDGSERLHQEFFIIFYRRFGGGRFEIWNPMEGLSVLFNDSGIGGRQRTLTEIANGCINGDKLANAINWVLREGMGYMMLEARFAQQPDQTGEWIASFDAYSTDLPEGAPALPAKLDLAYPGRNQSRTVLQGVVNVAASGAGQAQLGDHRSYNFILNGEVLQNGELFDSFRYKFDFPAAEAAAAPDGNLPLVFQRYLRPGEYTLVVKIEDLNGKKFFRSEQKLAVPEVTGIAPALPPQDPESARLLEEANKAISSGETTVKIIRPQGDLQTGMLRFDTMTTGPGIEKVTFALDGKAVLTKKKPPFSVELDLGSLPRTRRLAVTAFDAAGKEIASDDLLINSAGHRFRVRLAEPQRGKHYDSSLLARAEAEVPDGQTLERVEFFLNETRVATLYQPPYVQPILLKKDEPLSYVRAVAFLTDGNSTEDLVFVNAPDIEQVNVDLVELFTTVLNRQGRPVSGLSQKDFSVTEDGVKQDIVRFETVTDLPIHTAVALDISASMEKSLDQTREAALRYFQETVESKDRAAVITFNDHPNLAVKFTNNVQDLAGGLAGLKAERGTALYDSLVFTLYYFNGLKGQRAILLLSDGKDEGSRFTFEDSLEYARRAGVTIYTIGLSDEVDKRKLSKIAEETGGRSFFPKELSELDGIYKTIEEELRSQYLIAYQSSSTRNDNNFRSVELKVGQPGLEARTMRGYYP